MQLIASINPYNATYNDNIYWVSSNEDVNNLFKMTPYYYKTGIDDQQKLASLESVETEAEFGIRIYRKDNRNA